MCGICGLVYQNKDRHVEMSVLRSMTNPISHRGPDADGHWIEKNVGLGFRRLAIIDLSEAGNQPMGNEDGSVQIVFNGEIYNYSELREELISKGHVFRSATDTETIIHLWEEEGVDCVGKLRGMFAFAIWDDNRKSLFLARDRAGQKPLHYAELGDKILFGSEIKSILQHPEVNREADIDALHHYLAFQTVPSPMTAFRGVRKLPPAHWLLYQRGETQVRRYWTLSYKDKLGPPKESLDLARIEEEVISRLRDAVDMRLMSDVPLGAFLSGGIDSSLIVALMSQVMGQPVKTFSIGFENEAYNELEYARKIANRFSTDHHEFVVTPDARAILPELVWHYNEPFADSSAIPTYYVSKLAREYVTVVLTGDGGDENFAGYSRYMGQSSESAGRWTNGLEQLRTVVLGMGLLNFSRPTESIKRLLRINLSRVEHYLKLTHFHEGYQRHLYTYDFMASLGDRRTIDWVLDLFNKTDAKSDLEKCLQVDFSFYLPDVLMTKMDIASMAHSLEARAPLLDHKFLEFVARIPANLKMRNGVSKFILKRAVARLLPDPVVNRPKMGFGVPIDDWFRGELKEMTYDILMSHSARERGYFKLDYVHSLIDRHQNGEDLHYLLWTLLMFELWHLRFIDSSANFDVA